MNTDTQNQELKKRSKIRVYFLAAPEEEDECRAIRKHLSPVIRNSKIPIEIQSDFEIPAGEDKEKYKLKLLESDIVLALISSDYISDDETYERTQKVIERYNKNETILVPILVRNCLWKSTPFVNLPLLPRNYQPLNNKQFWNSEDDALMAVVGDIYEAINKFSVEEALQLSNEGSPQKITEQKAEPAITVTEPEEISVQPDHKNIVTEVKVVGENQVEEIKTNVEPEKKVAETAQPVESISNQNENFQKNEKKAVMPIEVDWRKKYYRKVLWKRLGAFALDHLIMIPVFVFSLLLSMFFAYLVKDPNVTDLTGTETFFIFLIAFSIYFIINSKMESSKWRGTLGKRIMKLQITDRAGEPVSFFRAMGRNILRTVVGYLFIILLPFQYFRFKKTKKLFHDELSGTVIGERLTR
jgi:uncharacterized RDD family membrane protein YckC